MSGRRKSEIPINRVIADWVEDLPLMVAKAAYNNSVTVREALAERYFEAPSDPDFDKNEDMKKQQRRRYLIIFGSGREE